MATVGQEVASSQSRLWKQRLRPCSGFLCLIVCHFLAQASHCSASNNVTYVEVTDSPSSNASDSQGCGLKKTYPCRTVAFAIKAAQNHSRKWLDIGGNASTVLDSGSQMTNLYLVMNNGGQGQVTRPQILNSVDNVTITSDSSQLLMLDLAGPSFLVVRNSSFITIQNLTVNMMFSLGNGVLIEESHHVLVQNSFFVGIGINTHGVNVQDSMAVVLSALIFGGKVPLQAAPDLNLGYLSAALLISFHGARNMSDSTADISSASPWSVLNGSDVALVRSTIDSCGIQRIHGIYKRIFPSEQEVGQSSAYHVHFHSQARGHKVLLQDCNMTDNVSPYDPTASIIFETGSENNQVAMQGCRYSGNHGYIGGALFVRYSSEGNNSVSVEPSASHPCLFTRNGALLEGATARLAFGGPLKDYPGADNNVSDFFHMTHCQVTNSTTGFTLTNMPGNIVATTLEETESELHGKINFQVQLSHCLFSHNVAQVGSAAYIHLTTLRVNNW